MRKFYWKVTFRDGTKTWRIVWIGPKTLFFVMRYRYQCLWRILIQQSGLAGRYNVAFIVLPLDLASWSGSATYQNTIPIDPEDEGTTLVRNVGNYLAVDMAWVSKYTRKSVLLNLFYAHRWTDLTKLTCKNIFFFANAPKICAWTRLHFESLRPHSVASCTVIQRGAQSNFHS
jgi:hypothetical protein